MQGRGRGQKREGRNYVLILSYQRLKLRSESHVVIDVRYDFRIETMFGSSLPLAVCSGALFTAFLKRAPPLSVPDL
jgi:hypothetical protein